jgi:16S rRNA (guanine1516-N2)-methyltransferase
LTSKHSSNLCVYSTSEADSLKALAFAKAHQLPVFSGKPVKLSAELPEDVRHYPYVLYYCRGRAEILQTVKGAPGAVSASFIGGKTAHRLKFGGGKGQMIAKAVGLNKGVTPSVLDATAGLGRDAFVLASLGCEVSLLERSPVIAELLRSALLECESDDSLDASERYELAAILARMSLLEVDASTWLKQQSDKVADVIHLDPMYPHREKSSLVKKEMRLFQDLVGEDSDDESLLAAALEKARYRVVVKRPRKGEQIKGPKPSLQLQGKSCRYDIYTLKRIDSVAS